MMMLLLSHALVNQMTKHREFASDEDFSVLRAKMTKCCLFARLLQDLTMTLSTIPIRLILKNIFRLAPKISVRLGCFTDLV